MNNRVVTGILMVFCLALVGLLFRQQGQIRSMRAAKESAVAAAPAPSRADRSTAQRAPETPSRTPARESSALSPPPPPQPRSPAAKKEQPANIMTALAGMMESPKMKEAMRIQQKAALGMMYGDLLNYLDLTGEDRQAFENLLLDRQMAIMEKSIQATQNTSDAKARKAEMGQIKKINQDFEDRIRSFLGEDDFAVFQDYEQTQPERMQMLQFKQSLAPALALSSDQEHALILAMNDARKNHTFAVDMKAMEENPSALTADMVAPLMRDLTQLNGQYRDRAAAILDPDQQKAFDSFLEQQLVMQEAGLNMTLQLFGTDE